MEDQKYITEEQLYSVYYLMKNVLEVYSNMKIEDFKNDNGVLAKNTLKNIHELEKENIVLFEESQKIDVKIDETYYNEKLKEIDEIFKEYDV